MAPFGRRIVVLIASLATTVTACVAITAAGQAQPPETWSAVSAPTPSNVSYPGLLSVSCVSASWCLGVGATSTGDLVETWDGSSWTVQAANDITGQLVGVSCTSTTFCMAVGSANDRSTVTEFWNGTAWTVVPSSNATDFVNLLEGVSCTSSTFCVADGWGYDSTDRAQHSVLMTWDGTAWTADAIPAGLPDQYDNLNGVSCTSSTFCVAVGNNFFPNGPTNIGRPLALFWDGTQWTVSLPPDPGTSGSTVLSGISCLSAQSCVAVGRIQASSKTAVPLSETWNGTAWSPQVLSAPSSTATELEGVSCPSTTYCAAVGESYVPGTFTVTQTLVETYDGTTWTSAPSPNPAGNINTLSGISCPAASTCAAVGSFATLDGADHPLVVSDYQPAAISDLALTNVPGPITAPATKLGYGAVTYPLPSALLAGEPDPNATVRCTPASGTLFAVNQTTTVQCEAVDSTQVLPGRAQFTVTVSAAAAPVNLTLTPSSASAPLGSTATFGAYVTDQYGNTAGVTPQTTFTGPNCTGPVCSAPAIGSYVITGRYQNLTATAQLTMTKQPVPFTVTGLVVAHKTVIFSGSATLPDGTVTVLQGLSCPVTDEGEDTAGSILTPSYAYGTYELSTNVCTVDPINSITYAVELGSGSVTSTPFGVTTGSLPGGRVKGSYLSRLTAAGGTSYSWSLVSGTPPPGVTLATNGQLSGTPTTAGTYPFTVQVRSGSSSMTWPYSITIAAGTIAPLQISSAWLPLGTPGKTYSQTLQATGGSGSKHWTLSGYLPTGLKLSASGQISGTPKYANDYQTFTITLTDTAKPADSVSQQFTIATNPIVITPTSTLKNAKVGSYYSVTFHATGGVAPLSWSVFGSPPPGLTMSKYGVYSGKPTAAGTYGFGVQLEDAPGDFAYAIVYLTIT